MDDFFQADVGLGSVTALEQRTGETIRVPVDEAREYVEAQPVVNVDETGWREANQKAWLWVAATKPVTVFLIRLSRGGKFAREMLGETFQGIVGSDRRSAYNWLPVLGACKSWGGTQSAASLMIEILEFCDDLTLRTMCGKTCAPICREVCDAVAYRPVSEYRY